jgi:hypothetical protein
MCVFRLPLDAPLEVEIWEKRLSPWTSLTAEDAVRKAEAARLLNIFEVFGHFNLEMLLVDVEAVPF